MATIHSICLGKLKDLQIIRQSVPEWDGPVDARIFQEDEVDDNTQNPGPLMGADDDHLDTASQRRPSSGRRGISTPQTRRPSSTPSATTPLAPPPALITHLNHDACETILLTSKDDPSLPALIVRLTDFVPVKLSKQDGEIMQRKLRRKRGHDEITWPETDISRCPACMHDVERGYLVYERLLAVMEDKYQGLAFRLVPRAMCTSCHDRLFTQLKEAQPPSRSSLLSTGGLRPLADVWNDPDTKAFVCSYSHHWFATLSRMSQKRVRRLEDEDGRYHLQSASSHNDHVGGEEGSRHTAPSSPAMSSDSNIPRIRVDSGDDRLRIGWTICFGICSRCRKPCKWKCSRCWSAYYCGRACQKKDWPVHRSTCHERMAVQGETESNDIVRGDESTETETV
ncbi:uncharacterized protein SPPG_09351 [Spizellomyces punctatus DAOM BR117]|uniref:MYND-type domain-containing protein n=1 Tax=Spizellomyces punctatus (strain DAOM BR117) TaxID=645134 RepID=A0A0L0HA66_SPIPD|nr:uncharacterized protein SPPG_09351 [Spizellomyces punctatus DAOM BR117]KNC98450.1 hypothetical protein SPPG_09351 [Spizellomyces punctatus DAOM BR117]|eukprot:XP_016606490.1 hypothetical protein SPPG_09351 [Spizellomyces punctatus DAOM BR117]